MYKLYDSTRKDKKFMVITPNGKTIYFGQLDTVIILYIKTKNENKDIFHVIKKMRIGQFRELIQLDFGQDIYFGINLLYWNLSMILIRDLIL
jgi:hypothetical protein